MGDHLVVRSVLGQGGTAVVYEAFHTRLRACVALKVLEVPEPFVQEAALRLQREAEVCASLHDPHVPRVYDVGALEDGTPYVVMEKVLGTTLEQLLAQGRLRLEVALAVADDLLRALEAVHGAGVVHRDIKPGNLIIKFGQDGSTHVRLMDFGISKSVCRDPGDPKLTRLGTVVGTPHYMAPEQITGDPVDARADLYSTGVVLFEMLTGRPPYEGASTAEIVGAVLRQASRPLASLWPGAPPPLEEVVSRAMAASPQERFMTARDFRLALAEALLVRASERREVSASNHAGPRAKKGLGKAAFIAVGLGVCAATLGWPGAAKRDPQLSARVSAESRLNAAAVSKDGPRAAATPVPLPMLVGASNFAPPGVAPELAPEPQPEQEPELDALEMSSAAPTARSSRFKLLTGRELALEPISTLASDPNQVASAQSVETSRVEAVREHGERRRREPRPVRVESGILISDYLERLDAIQRAAAEPPAHPEDVTREGETPAEDVAPSGVTHAENVPDNPYPEP